MIKFFKENIIFFASSFILVGFIASLLNIRKTFDLNQPENTSQTSVNSTMNTVVPPIAPIAVSSSIVDNKIITKNKINLKKVSNSASLPASIYKTNFNQKLDLYNLVRNKKHERDDD